MNQQMVEGGFRFLKAPWFMVDSVFLKSPHRIESLMMDIPNHGGDGSSSRTRLSWIRKDLQSEYAHLLEGCYLLPTRIVDWTPDPLWTAYTQLSDAEAAFNIQKNDLRLRPIWHQKDERISAHIFVTFYQLRD